MPRGQLHLDEELVAIGVREEHGRPEPRRHHREGQRDQADEAAEDAARSPHRGIEQRAVERLDPLHEAPSPATAAVQRQLELGTHYGACCELELRWAQLIQRLMPAAELVRFTSSGTEATLLAIRLARAF